MANEHNLKEWIILLIDFENSNPDKKSRQDFDLLCGNTSHMKLEERVLFIREKLNLWEMSNTLRE